MTNSKKPATLALQNLMSHHVTEIKRLQNSNEPYKNENIALLDAEMGNFKRQLEAL